MDRLEPVDGSNKPGGRMASRRSLAATPVLHQSNGAPDALHAGPPPESPAERRRAGGETPSPAAVTGRVYLKLGGGQAGLRATASREHGRSRGRPRLPQKITPFWVAPDQNRGVVRYPPPRRLIIRPTKPIACLARNNRISPFNIMHLALRVTASGFSNDAKLYARPAARAAGRTPETGVGVGDSDPTPVDGRRAGGSAQLRGLGGLPTRVDVGEDDRPGWSLYEDPRQPGQAVPAVRPHSRSPSRPAPIGTARSTSSDPARQGAGDAQPLRRPLRRGPRPTLRLAVGLTARSCPRGDAATSGSRMSSEEEGAALAYAAQSVKRSLQHV